MKAHLGARSFGVSAELCRSNRKSRETISLKTHDPESRTATDCWKTMRMSSKSGRQNWR